MVVGSSSTAGKSFEDVWVAKESSLSKHYGEALWVPAPFPDGLKDVSIVAADVSPQFPRQSTTSELPGLSLIFFLPFLPPSSRPWYLHHPSGIS
jgi:hypothetical protein